MHNNKDHFRELGRLYLAAPINKIFPPKIDIESGSAVILLEHKSDFNHAAGSLHGSVYFKLLDDAAFFAAQSLVDDVFILTSSFTIYLLKPVKRGQLRSEGRIVKVSKNLLVAEAELFDSNGHLVAKGSGAFIKSQTPLSTVFDLIDKT